MKIDYARFNSECVNKILPWKKTHDIEFDQGKKLLITDMKVFHYTSLDTFWKIVESNTFWAMHVRFSNDTQEYSKGQEIISALYNDNLPHDNSCFMICFCSKGNLLSQWREYAQIGVSLGLDFSRESVFTILNNKEHAGKNSGMCKYPGTNKEPDEQSSEIYKYLLPVKVLYTVQDKEPSIPPTYFFWYSGKEVDFEEVKKAVSGLIKFGFEEEKELRGIIPYIKHGAFQEEMESRLIFDLTPDLGEKHVFYLDSGGCKKPYLKIKYGDAREFKNKCTYVDIDGNIDKTLVSAIKTAVRRLDSKIIIRKNGHHQESPINIYISAGDNQQALFEIIDGECEAHAKRTGTEPIKTWCDGYWPIRSIMVGPCLGREMIKESIENYCKNHYWLKYITVSYSPTPYRGKP